MSYLAMSLDTLQTISNLIDKGDLIAKDGVGFNINAIKSDIDGTIKDITNKEKDLCSECRHCKATIGDFYEPSESICTANGCEFKGDLCPIWYGDEVCVCYQPQLECLKLDTLISEYKKLLSEVNEYNNAITCKANEVS